MGTYTHRYVLAYALCVYWFGQTICHKLRIDMDVPLYVFYFGWKLQKKTFWLLFSSNSCDYVLIKQTAYAPDKCPNDWIFSNKMHKQMDGPRYVLSNGIYMFLYRKMSLRIWYCSHRQNYICMDVPSYDISYLKKYNIQKLSKYPFYLWKFNLSIWIDKLPNMSLIWL